MKMVILFLIFVLFAARHQEIKLDNKIISIEKLAFQKFEVDQNIIPDSISKKFKKFNKNNDVVCLQSLGTGNNYATLRSGDYHSNAFLSENDMLNIWINNFNGNFGNGVLMKVFDDQFYILSDQQENGPPIVPDNLKIDLL